MKIQVKNYTFNAINKTISFDDFSAIRLDSVLLVTNVTDNIIIYNFACDNLGGTVSGNTLTLNYDTSGMSDTDSLQIFYQTDTVDSDTLEGIYELLSRLQVLTNAAGTSADIRVTPLSLPTLGTVTTVTNLQQLNGISSNLLINLGYNNNAVISNINNVAS